MLPTNDAEFKQQLTTLERFFTLTDSGGFFFAVANDELMQAKINQNLQFLLQGKNKELRIFSLKYKVLEVAPLTLLQQFLEQHPTTKGLLITDLEPAVTANPNLLTQLNFAREELSRLGLPLLFWLNTRTHTLVQREAADLYDQRSGSVIYIDATLQTVDEGRFEQYKAVQTTKDNADLQQYQARLQLLQNQLNEAEKQGWPPASIANEIVVELLEIYVELPDSANLLNQLLNKYEAAIDDSNPDNLFRVARAYNYLVQLEKAIDLYKATVTLYCQLAEKNPQAFLPSVAHTLNNLANLHWNTNNYNLAASEYQEALFIFRHLAEKNPLFYLPYVATTLNNLAVLHINANEYSLAAIECGESLDIRRKLAEKNPYTYLPQVANTLNNLAILHRNMNEYSLATKEFEEALGIYRQLAERNQQLFLLDVAKNLNNLANLHLNLNEYNLASSEFGEALGIYRQLAVKNPQAYLPSVGITLNNLASLYCKIKNYPLAVKIFEESIIIRRQLAEMNPQAYLPDLAMTAANMAIFYQDNQSNQSQSLDYAKEAILASYRFKNNLPRANKHFYDALNVVKVWGLDEQAFLQEALDELPKDS